MNRISVLQRIITHKFAKIYLEIGVFNGVCFLKIKAPIKIGVDPNLLISQKEKIFSGLRNVYNLLNKYYEMKSDEFFRLQQKILSKKGLDVVFIDGKHTYNQSLKDVLNSLEFLNKDGVIVMHDCNPPTETSAIPAKSYERAKSLNLPEWTGVWSGDVWKTIVYLRSNRKDLNVFVLDCDNGLGIICRGKAQNMLNFSPQFIKNLTYKDLDKNRENFLNLKKEIYLKQFLDNNISRGKYDIIFNIFTKFNELSLVFSKIKRKFLKNYS